MKKTIFIFMFINIYSFISSTAQVADIIYIENIKYQLFTNPIESFFQLNPDLKIKPNIYNTSLMRGYIATFVIEENFLYLTDVKIEEFNNNKYDVAVSVLNEIFPGKKKVRCDFFSGILIIPLGKMINYIHAGYSRIYENYILYNVVCGQVLGSKKFGADEYIDFKKRQFIEYKETNKFKTELDDIINLDKSMPNIKVSEKDINNNNEADEGNELLKLQDRIDNLFKLIKISKEEAEKYIFKYNSIFPVEYLQDEILN